MQKKTMEKKRICFFDWDFEFVRGFSALLPSSLSSLTPTPTFLQPIKHSATTQRNNTAEQHSGVGEEDPTA